MVAMDDFLPQAGQRSNDFQHSRQRIIPVFPLPQSRHTFTTECHVARLGATVSALNLRLCLSLRCFNWLAVNIITFRVFFVALLAHDNANGTTGKHETGKSGFIH